ncbi:MAG: hypothetical protein GY854_33550 [Deltaproteobacteria bacterium]|nr:hypothetical protein [Deltaproteobacteria bacterium]
MTDPTMGLKKRLKEESPEVRRRAVQQIADFDPRQAIELVIEALSDDDWRVRKEAVSIAVGMRGEACMISRLIDEIVQEDNIGLRNAAAEALTVAGTEAVTEIIERMPRLNEAGRKIAIEVLGASNDPRIVEVLIERLVDPDYNVRGTAAEWLGEQGGEKAIKALLKCLKAPDRILVLTALQSLNRIGASIPWSILEPLTNEKLYGAELLLALGRSGSVKAAPIIAEELAEDLSAARAMELLHNSSPEAAAAVEAVLIKNGDKAISSLADWAQNGEPGEQRAATSCILWSRPTEHMTMIVDLAPNESLHSLILYELKRWGPTAVYALELLVPGIQGRQLASVIRLMAQLVDSAEGRAKTDFFASYLDSEDLATATAAAGAVARFGDDRVVERLLDLTDAPDNRVRRVAGYSLAEVGRRHPEEIRKMLATVELGGPRGIQLCRVIEVVGRPEDAQRLNAALSSPISKLRVAALRALASISGAIAVETIALAMTDEDLSVRIAAAGALGRIGPAASETIVSALHSAKGPLKAALLRALGQVGHPEAPMILLSMCRESTDIALAALEAMRELGLDATQIQKEILLHEDGEVIKQALTVLGSSLSISQLIGLLEHSQWDVRLAAVDRLSLNKDDAQVRKALETHIGIERDDLVTEAIKRTLEQQH